MYGYRMSTTEGEQLDVRHLFASAMERRAPVRVSFFKQKGKDSDGRPLYVKVTRVVEPYEFGVTRDGHRIVKVVDRTPDGTWGPEYRTIRLDRVAHSLKTGRPIAVRMLSHHYMCPSRLDYRELHPTKRVLVAA